MRSPLFVSLMLSASVVWAGSSNDQVLRDLGPDKKLCVCGFHLRGASKGGIPPAFLGVWGALKKEPNATPYSEELSAAFLRIYEEALGKAGAFQLLGSDELRAATNQGPQALSEAARDNDLFACVSADSVLGVAVGWEKKVNVISEWQLTGPSGWELRFKTKATSEEAQGMFPDTTDPLLEPVFRQLARKSVKQFLEQLGVMMKKAGCNAEIDLAAVEPAAAAVPQASPAAEAPTAALLQHTDGALQFVDNGDGTITDTQSGLMLAAGDNGGDISWDDAKAYCQSFRGGGHTDWRMPTVAELRGLFDANQNRRAACGLKVNVSSYIELTCARVWSSDTGSPASAEAALFDLRASNSIQRNTVEYMRALPVRSATPPASTAGATPPAAPATTVAEGATPAATVSEPAARTESASAQPTPVPVSSTTASPAGSTAAPPAVLVLARGGEAATGGHVDAGVLHPVKLDRKWGYVDSRGKMFIRPQFDSAARFAEGHARVSLAEEITIKNQYAPDSRAMRHKYGWIDENGQTVITLEFERAGDFSEGLAPAGRAFTNTSGESKFTTIYAFEDGVLSETMFFESRFDYIDKASNLILHTDFEEALPFSETLAAVSPPQGHDDQKWGFIDRSGKLVIAARFRDASSFSEGLAAVRVKDNWGYIDHEGAVVVKPQYTWAKGFAGGLAAVGIESKWGFIDRTGKLVVPMQFEGAEPFAEGLAPVKHSSNWGYIDKTGVLVIPCTFERARSFTGGMAAVKSGGKWGFIDRTGTFVVAPQFEDAL